MRIKTEDDVIMAIASTIFGAVENTPQPEDWRDFETEAREILEMAREFLAAKV